MLSSGVTHYFGRHMNYKVTTQYARGEEILIAEFRASHDATIFLTKKISTEQQQAKKKIYRLYGDSELLREFNPDNISVFSAKYAEGDYDFINPVSFVFNVTMQTDNVLEKNIIANFNDLNDANLFIIGKCETDSSVNDNDFFGIFKERVIIKTLNKTIIANQKIVSEGSKGKQSTATFNPTPMPRRPTPPGGPSDCWIEPEDDNKS